MRTYYCDMEVTLEIIGGKWKPLVLFHVLKGPKRTSELKRLIQNISQKMLVQTLRELETSGLLTRKIYNQVPPKVEYSATELGRSLSPILKELCEWGGNYAEKTFSANEYEILDLE